MKPQAICQGSQAVSLETSSGNSLLCLIESVCLPLGEQLNSSSSYALLFMGSHCEVRNRVWNGWSKGGWCFEKLEDLPWFLQSFRISKNSLHVTVSLITAHMERCDFHGCHQSQCTQLWKHVRHHMSVICLWNGGVWIIFWLAEWHVFKCKQLLCVCTVCILYIFSLLQLIETQENFGFIHFYRNTAFGLLEHVAHTFSLNPWQKH